MELAELERVEAVARGVGVTGVRAGAGDHGADVEHHPGRRRTSSRPAPTSRPARRGRAAGGRAGAGTAPRAPTIASESSRWNETTHGLRSVSTVMPPITAWAGMPRPSTSASRRRSRRPRCARRRRRSRPRSRPARRSASGCRTRSAGATPSAPCGVNDPSVQRGQVGQPRPEPVSRTAPPVTTSTMLATSVAQPSGRSQRGGQPRRSVTPT